MMTCSLWVKVVSLIAVLGGFLLLGYSLGWGRYLDIEVLRSVVTSYGVFAPLVFIALYAGAVLLVVPGAPLTLAGGALFGPWWGTLYIVAGASAGAVLAFLIARYIRGEQTSARVGSAWRMKLAAYDQAMAKHGFMTVLFLRLVPVFPFSVLNYGLGFSSVRLRKYTVATVVGIIPGTFTYAYFGNALAMLRLTELLIAVLLLIGLIIVGRCLLTHHGKFTTKNTTGI
jgi:uncharacterized membrane protein YdjX (TVP38/TMEM64 family)